MEQDKGTMKAGGTLGQPFNSADLPIDEQGRIYHLEVRPEDVAPDILLVGDPGRAEMIAATFFDPLEMQHEHRGLVTATGTLRLSGERVTLISPLRATVSTSGMGTPSLEIVANELVAANEIDFSTRQRKASFPRMHIIRLGTSGAMHARTRPGTLVITTYAIGLDNSGLFYEAPTPDGTSARLERELHDLLRKRMNRHSRFFGSLYPYVGQAHPAVVSALIQAARDHDVPSRTGLTVSSPGFFATQGRDIGRVPPSLPNLDRILADFDPMLEGQAVENMEMEASFLLHLMGGLGHWAGVACMTIANREDNSFDANYKESIQRATRVALQALADLRQQDVGDISR